MNVEQEVQHNRMSKQQPHDAAEHFLPPSDAPAPEQGIDLLAVAVALLSEWRLATITFFIVAAACTAYIYSLKPQFVAHATFLPQEGRSESTNLSSIFSNHGPGTLYIGLLQSQTVQNGVINNENLLSLFQTASMEAARDKLAGISSFSEGGDGIVTIAIKFADSQDAARIANAYLVALQNVNRDMSKQQSDQTVAFFKDQLGQEQKELTDAETVLASTQRQTGVIDASQTGATLSAIQSTRDQITALESQRAVLLLSETEQNPQVQRLSQNIAVLRGKELQLEGSGNSPLGAATPAGQVPQANLEILRAQRTVKYHEVLVNSLANQFETARLNQEERRSAFQTVDSAVAPERKAWPPRKPFFLISLVFSALMGVIAVTFKLMTGRLLRDPEHREQLRQLRRAFGAR